MNSRHQLLFLASLIVTSAAAQTATPPSPVWTPPQLAGTPTPAAAPGSDAVAGQPAASPVAAIDPAHSADLLSTLANRQDQPVTLSTDEAAGVEMTKEWRDRAVDYESQNQPMAPSNFVGRRKFLRSSAPCCR